MTEQELEEKIKEKFESIMDSSRELLDKYASTPGFLEVMFVLLGDVMGVYSRTPLHIDEKDIKHKWTYLIYKISQRLPARLSIISKSPNEFVNLSEADEYLKDIDNKLKDGKNVLDLLDELNHKELKND
ncbi:MAG: hypothetical protein IJ545_01155 [Alphaproteobacteria bacterium]|nr:hypothetical protein [Alphaproteobacteria bacterium]